MKKWWTLRLCGRHHRLQGRVRSKRFFQTRRTHKSANSKSPRPQITFFLAENCQIGMKTLEFQHGLPLCSEGSSWMIFSKTKWWSEARFAVSFLWAGCLTSGSKEREVRHHSGYVFLAWEFEVLMNGFGAHASSETLPTPKGLEMASRQGRPGQVNGVASH